MLNPHHVMQQLLAAGRAWSCLIIFVSSMVEYVFPPFPGDTVTLIAAILAGAYGYPVWALCLALFAGSIAGTLIDYYAGHSLVRLWPGSRGLEQARQKMERWGPVLVVLNRFFPGIRAFILVAAGMARMGVLKVLALSGISILLWNGLLFGAGWMVGENLDRLVALFKAYVQWFYAGFGALTVIILIRWLVKRKTRNEP